MLPRASLPEHPPGAGDGRLCQENGGGGTPFLAGNGGVGLNPVPAVLGSSPLVLPSPGFPSPFLKAALRMQRCCW